MVVEEIFDFASAYSVAAVDLDSVQPDEWTIVLPGPREGTQPAWPPGSFARRIEPAHGASWVGVFMPDDPGFVDALSAPPHIIGWPDPAALGVVWSGQGYVIPTTDPLAAEEMRLHPITDILVSAAQDSVFLTDLRNVVAYGPSGLRWRIDRLFDDDLRIRSLSGWRLELGGYYSGQTETVAVDARDGTIIE